MTAYTKWQLSGSALLHQDFILKTDASLCASNTKSSVKEFCIASECSVARNSRKSSYQTNVMKSLIKFNDEPDTRSPGIAESRHLINVDISVKLKGGIHTKIFFLMKPVPLGMQMCEKKFGTFYRPIYLNNFPLWHECVGMMS